MLLYSFYIFFGLTHLRSWLSAGLPVVPDKLSLAQSYLFQLADRFVSLAVEEGGRITGVLCSVRSSRSSQVGEANGHPHTTSITSSSSTQTKEKLQQALSLTADLLPYLVSGTGGPHSWDVEQLLTKATAVSVSFISICLREFDGHVQKSQRQVCLVLTGMSSLHPPPPPLLP